MMRILHWSRRSAGVLLAGAALFFGANDAAAQLVQFFPPEVADRRVVLRWNPAPGDTLSAAARRNCRALCGECCEDVHFGGYQIWKGVTGDPASMVLVRSYALFDSTWTFRGNERVFVDPDSASVRGCGGIPGLDEDFCDPLTGKAIAPFNGFKYWYAVTWFDSKVDSIGGRARVREIERQGREQGILASPVQPAALPSSEAPLLGRVHVIPNPYDPSDEFGRQQFGTEERVQFVNLPSPGRIKIYTIAGDLIRELLNDDDDGAIDWDLKNADGEDVVPGVYMFVAETGDGSQRRNGHFVIIR
jgi:hypothetical protein